MSLVILTRLNDFVVIIFSCLYSPLDPFKRFRRNYFLLSLVFLTCLNDFSRDYFLLSLVLLTRLNDFRRDYFFMSLVLLTHLNDFVVIIFSGF